MNDNYILKGYLRRTVAGFLRQLWSWATSVWAMEALAKKREKWFDYIIFYLKLLAMHPLDFSLLPTRLRFLRYPLNFFFYAFWHFIILHLAYVQDVSVYLNLDQTLDDIISFVMNGNYSKCQNDFSYSYFTYRKHLHLRILHWALHGFQLHKTPEAFRLYENKLSRAISER